jgi:ferredoxin-NADP reductase
VFERSDGLPSAFYPGQWHNLFATLPDGTELKRPYSIASPPDGSPRFELTVTRIIGGPMSELLHAMPIGSELRAVGPHGMFHRAADDPAPALFVGTGAGIAPLRSMYKAALQSRSTVRMKLLFGVRHEEDILYREELEALQREHPGFGFEVTLSKPPASWSGRQGHVQLHLQEMWESLGAVDGHVYICGLDRMVKDVRDRCRTQLGIGRKQVHQERFDAT